MDVQKKTGAGADLDFVRIGVIARVQARASGRWLSPATGAHSLLAALSPLATRIGTIQPREDIYHPALARVALAGSSQTP
jgi:hypothetical protein